MKVYYYDAETGAEIAPDAPHELSCSRLLELFEALSSENGSFVGFILENDRTVQFIYDAGDLWLDIPDPTMQGSWTKLMEYADAVEILKDACAGGDPMTTKDLSFEGW